MQFLGRLLLLVTVGSAAAGLYGPNAGEADSRSIPSFEGLRPVVPPDGVAAGARPVFQLAFEGVAPREARRMRFRLALSLSGSSEEAYVFDQRRRRSGWLVTSDGSAIFRPPRALADGEYSWSFAAWNGVEWVQAGEKRDLRVDTVPPAAVEGIRLSHERDGDRIRLVWDPVALDENGDPEFVTGYHVYRYAQNPDLPHVRAFEVGLVEVPEFTDGPPGGDGSILYYRIAAEDEAGNISVRKGPDERITE